MSTPSDQLGSGAMAYIFPTVKLLLQTEWPRLSLLRMTERCFDFVLSDDQLREQLGRGEAFLLKGSSWQEIERQIERLGFDDFYLVSQVSGLRGKLTKVTPVAVRQAA